MKVTKRNGKNEDVNLNKITDRIKKLKNFNDQELKIDEFIVAKKVINGLYDGVTTKELDNLAAETAATMSTIHPDYDTLAARIEVSNLHKETNNSFSKKIKELYKVDIISKEFYEYVLEHSSVLDSITDYSRDYLFDYFGVKTLKRSYLLKDKKGVIIERPQDMWLRVAAFIHKGDIEATKETYDLLSQKYFTHATPTLFNAGTVRPQLSSCFLLDIADDSITGIYKTISDCAKISQSAGGIGLSISKIRGSGSYIKGTNGVSNGITPMLRVFDATARYVDQCFTGDTLIYTDIGAQPFRLLNPARKVVTNDGTLKSIKKIVEHDIIDKNAIKIKVKKSIRPITVTDLHPFYTIRNQKLGLNHEVIRNRLNKKFIAPDWIEAKDLTENDLIGFPIPKIEVDQHRFTEEDCWLYGLMLGDGNMQYDSNNGFKIHLGSHESYLINRLRKYCVDRSINYQINIEGTKTVVVVNSNVATPIKRRDLYAGGKKYFSPELQLLPVNKSLAILQGLMDSDGHYGKKELLLEMTSKSVIEGVRYMLLRLGVLTSGYDRNRIGTVSSYKNITTKQETICLRIPKEKIIVDYLKLTSGRSTAQFVWDDIIWTRVAKITPTKLSGKVYDLEVEENHNYLTEIGLVHNGGGKRKGSIAIYIEPWHSDIFEFLDLKKNHGKEELRARDLFYALWIPDLFMKRVKEDGEWSLFDPAIAYVEIGGENKYLYDLHSEEFELAYSQLELEGKAKRSFPARELWDKILVNQIETGVPYMLYKDACNSKSNQKNLGTIKSSNLCTEIIEYTDEKETAVCNLASISLPAFVKPLATLDDPIYYNKLYEVSKTITKNLNKVIDVNYYPTKEGEYSNKRHRPIGIGVQGLADLYAILNLDFDSEEAKEINKRIFETIYKGSIDSSIELAREKGTYSSYDGSPSSRGHLQFDLWGLDRDNLWLSWEGTFKNLELYGLYNSLLLAPMPTASTAQILGNNEAFEPFTSNLGVRRTLAGEFIVINKHLIKELIELGIWDDKLRQKLMAANGSVQEIAEIPANVRSKYRTAYEMSARAIIDQAADRGPFICQSQSMNIFMSAPTVGRLTSLHFYAWERGLKTGMYYLRSEPARDAIKFTLTNEKTGQERSENANTPKELYSSTETQACSIDDPSCESCSG